MPERAFTLFLHDGSATPPAFEIEYFPDVDAAKQRALQLLKERPRYDAVEVSDGLSSTRVKRPAV